MRISPAKTYGLLLVLFTAGVVKGQQASAVMDRDEILIGEQVTIRLSVPFNKANPPAVKFPMIGDTLVDKVEVLRTTKVDTLQTGPEVKETRIEQQIFITSFDSGYYAIPPFEIEIDGVISRTEPFLLTVNTVEVDTTKGIAESRDIYAVPVDWKDYVAVYWPYAVGGILLVAILTAGAIFFERYREKQKQKPAPLPLEPVRPAHVVAIENLDRIRQEKAYKSGQIKAHHTAITDTLRTYLESVFGIHAHELTTKQIMDKLRYSGIEGDQLKALRTILFRADMVKFAKEKPDETDNEEAVIHAIQFVEATAIQTEEKTEKAIEPEGTEKEKGGDNV